MSITFSMLEDLNLSDSRDGHFSLVIWYSFNNLLGLQYPVFSPCHSIVDTDWSMLIVCSERGKE